MDFIFEFLLSYEDEILDENEEEKKAATQGKGCEPYVLV